MTDIEVNLQQFEQTFGIERQREQTVTDLSALKWTHRHVFLRVGGG